jgi:hypothetical protein
MLKSSTEGRVQTNKIEAALRGNGGIAIEYFKWL